ncbi:hypothetical protein PENSPDRAFT_664367 [Peniophora sp. CONT]|nr:hypothetical protein PENSPDRAFT_664367 [Peniophora sp. CONT]
MPHNHAQRHSRPYLPPRSFRFHYKGSEGRSLRHIIDRQAACGKPVDLAWLLDAQRHGSTIPIEWVELDSAQDLLLLMHHDQPHHPGAQGITIYPVQLADATDSHGKTNAHRQARKAEIFVKWAEGDRAAEGQDTLVVEMHLCGDHFALFILYAGNPRVVIYNWKTGKRIARVDAYDLHTNAKSPHLVEPPLFLHQFTWLAPCVFMIGSLQQNFGWPPGKDSLYIYQLGGNPEQPLSRSVTLELPRWKPDLRCHALEKELDFVAGSWSEDIYPGALSSNMHRRVTVVQDECWNPELGYCVFYVLQNDVLLSLLAQYNGRVLRWEAWSGTCARAFQGVPRTSKDSTFMDIQVCGRKVMMVTSDKTQGTCQVEVADFDRNTLDPRMIPGTIVANGARVAESLDSMFELGCVWTNLPYRSIPLPGSIDSDTKFILRPDRILYTRRTDGWRKAKYITVQATYPPQVTQGSAAGYR